MACLIALVVAISASVLATGSAGAATRRATSVRAADMQLSRAKRAYTAKARELKLCQRAHARRCAGLRRASKRAAARLAGAKRLLARIDGYDPAAAAASAGSSAAPKLTVAGGTLHWNQVGNVTSYVFVRKVPGAPDQYSTVAGNAATPPAAPGKTVHFSVRTNVANSAWAPEVTITYSASTASSGGAATTTSPITTSAPTPSPGPVLTSAPQIGVVAGSALSYELPFIQQLGARTARMEFDIDTPASQIAPIVRAYAAAGIKPLLLASFYGRLPTTAEAQSVATWAAQFGPGGSYWQGRSEPAGTAVTDIEFGNETSYSYQFADNSPSTYAARAQTYALRVKDATTAINAANANVGLLAIGDNAQQGNAWVANMFKAVPDLGQRVAGWTIHPYGPGWAARLDSTVASTAAAGTALPIWVTEYGLSTDNGRCLDDNYGWNPCMTYGQAADTLQATLGGIESRYGSRLGGFFLYQAHDQGASGVQSRREYYFGALQSNGAGKGAYTAEVKSALAQSS